MIEQSKILKGIKIISGLMFAIGFGIGLWCITILITTSLVWTTSPGGPTSVTFEPSSSWAIYISDTVNLLFVAPLFIIAGIGLWRIKEWGLFLSLIALTSKIFLEIGLFAKDITKLYLSPNVSETAGIIIEGKDLTWIDAILFDSWMYLPTLCIMIFAIISIVYLWKNRRCFS